MKKILILMMLVILLAGTLSAFEFDNIKTYDTNTRTAILKNSILGIPTTEIASVRLDTPLMVKVPVGYHRVAQFTINSNTDYKDFLQQLEFYNLNQENTKITRSYDFKYLSYEAVEIDEFKTVCSLVKADNGTFIDDCDRVKSGSHTEYKNIWRDFSNLDISKDQTLTVGIFTNVQRGDKIDWVPTFAGVKISEWAGWTESLNVDLVDYFTFDNNKTTGTTTLGSVINTNGTLVNGVTTNVTGASGEAFNFNDDDNEYVNLDQSLNTAFDGDFTISLWINADDANPATQIFLDSRNPADNEDGCQMWANSGVFNTIFNVGGTSRTLVGSAVTGGGGWYHLVVKREGNNVSIFQNGAYEDEDANAGNNANLTHTGHIKVATQRGLTAYFDGQVDEIAIWERALSDEEIVYIYNGGTAISYSAGGSVNDSLPTVLPISPADNSYYITSPQDIDIICYGSDDINFSEMDLYFNGVLNGTNSSGLNNTNYTFTMTGLTDGTYTWNCTAYDNATQSSGTIQRDFKIDSTSPILSGITNVTNKTTFILPYTLIWGYNASDSNLEDCYYNTSDNSSYTVITCNTDINTIFNTEGSKLIQYCANDTGSFETCNIASFSLGYIQENAYYNSTIIEGNTGDFILNITTTGLSSLNGTFHYNGTDYTTTATINGNTGLLTKSLIIPTINTNTFIPFNWTYNLNGIEYNSSEYNQTIIYLTPLNITSEECTDKALRFDIQDEENLSALYGDIEYNFKFGSANDSLKELYGSITNVTTFYICINATVSENYTIGYGEIQYRDSGYVDRRYYLFEGSIISNNTLTNHTLRDLVTADQTSFLLTLEDTSLSEYTNKYTALWRWYPDLNEYQIVEMGKTDDDGQTVIHVNIEDTDYRIGLYEPDGTLINLDSPRRFVCTTSPCSLTVRVGAGDLDYSSFFDVQTDLTYNETTKVFTLIYNDPNQYTNSMNLLVTRETGTSTLVICNTTSSGFSGVITCNTSAYTGLKRAIVYRTASPSVIIAQKIVNTANNTFRSSFGLFISLFLWLGIILTGFSNSPLWTLILAVVGLIPALIMGSINVAIFTGIAVLGALVIHFIKRASAK